MCAKPDRQTGLTLIELIVSIVIISVALAGVLTALNVTVKGSADPLQPKQALTIAEALLEEALLKNYSPPVGGYTATCAATTYPTISCPGGICPAGCTRASFDDIGDMHNFSDAPVTGYWASVSVAAENTADLPGVAARRITVNVRQPSGQTVSLSGYRANY